MHLFTKDSTMNTSIDITIDPSPDLLDVDSLQDPRSLSRRSSLRASITSVDFSKTEFQLDVSNYTYLPTSNSSYIHLILIWKIKPTIHITGNTFD